MQPSRFTYARLRTLFAFWALFCFAFSDRLSAEESKPYFQQTVRYSIGVTLDDVNHFLRGDESVTYINHSRDTLRLLYFHLWPNAYRDEGTVLAKTYYNDQDLRFINAKEKGRGFIDSLDFAVNGISLDWSLLNDTPDVAILRLRQPLPPEDSVTIHTPLRMKYPSAGISRLGHTGQAYYTTQWFPKPAVYDRGGWKYLEYVDKGEFYSEYGSFDVSITLPKNYVVAATGELIGCEEEKQWLNERSKATALIDTFDTKNLSFPPSSDEYKTLHYQQDHVHDFAFFADKRWHVLARTMRLPDSKREVKVVAYFTNHQAKWWKKAPEYMERAVTFLSTHVGEYPYSTVSAVDVIYAEGSDMEYPMITAIGNAANPYQLDAVLAHELGHNWFYGILGNDERRSAWLDEGVNSFFEKRYLFTTYASDSASMNEYFNRMGRWGKWTGNTRMDGRLKQYYRYLSDARLNIDQPLTTRSESYTLRNYSDMVYAKTSLGFQYLLDYLGDSVFDACMQRYYDLWKFKHPEPEDMKSVFEAVSEKDLDWLFEGWLKTTEKLDYAVKQVTTDDATFQVTLRNEGDLKGPVAIETVTRGGLKQTRWLEGFRGDTTVTIKGKPAYPRIIDTGRWMPEVNRKNNSYREGGILRRMEPLQLRLLTDVEDEQRTQLYVAPAVGWNYYNSVMTGVVLHNVGYPQKNFEFAAMPLYAFGTKDLNGGANFSYRLHPSSSLFREIRLRSGFCHYAYAYDEYSNKTNNVEIRQTLRYSRLENSIRFDLKNPEPRNQVASHISFRHVLIEQDVPYETAFRADNTNTKNFFELNYNIARERSWKSFMHEVSVTFNADFMRFRANTNYRFPYADVRKGFYVGGSVGFVNINSGSDGDYRLRLGGRNGKDDYLFDGTFLGRSETTGILSQQFLPTDGGFATPVGFYRLSEHLMAALHLKTDLPGKVPVLLFANLAVFDQPKLGWNEENRISWEGGLEIRVVRDIFTVYMPLVFSRDIRHVVIEEKQLNFGERIRFELNLKKLNPLENLNK